MASLTLAIVLTYGRAACGQQPLVSYQANPPVVTTELVQIGNTAINLSQVNYVWLTTDQNDATKCAGLSASVYFAGAMDKPLRITGREADELRWKIAARGLPLSDRMGAVNPEEARRRGFGNPNSHTFGGLGVPAQGGGIFLIGSVPGTPAEALGLEYGDVLVSINGAQVNTQGEYVAAVHGSPDEMQFVLRNVRTGQLQNMSVRLSR